MKARTPSKPDARLTKMIGARLTEADYARIAAEADAEGLTIAHYCTRVLLAHLDKVAA